VQPISKPHARSVPPGARSVPTWQHRFSDFSTFTFLRVKFWFSNRFNPVFTYMSQSLKPLKFYYKTMFSSLKKTWSNSPKRLIFQKCLKRLFTQKSNFPPKDPTPKTFLFKIEILIHITQHNNFITPLKIIKIKLLLFWSIFTKITKTQQVNQTSHLSSSNSWILITKIYPTTFVAHKSWIQH